MTLDLLQFVFLAASIRSRFAPRRLYRLQRRQSRPHGFIIACYRFSLCIARSVHEGLQTGKGLPQSYHKRLKSFSSCTAFIAGASFHMQALGLLLRVFHSRVQTAHWTFHRRHARVDASEVRHGSLKSSEELAADLIRALESPKRSSYALWGIRCGSVESCQFRTSITLEKGSVIRLKA